MTENTSKKQRSRKRTLMASSAVLAGAALLAAGGYAAFTSSAILGSGRFSVTDTPGGGQPGTDAEAVLLANGQKKSTVNLSLQGLENNSQRSTSDKVAFTNGGTGADAVPIEDLVLQDVSINGAAASTELQQALTVEFVLDSGSQNERSYTATLADLVNNPGGFQQDVKLDPSEASSSDWTFRVTPADDLTSAASQEIDSVSLTFTGTTS
ncbi:MULTISPECIES: hypothetical protein [unclassified Streptomyces]|uniref:hypothetical protein n=1 Tax=unclassified Streptomyces TaxID=2593676 RepID=UPI00278BC304|nr:MULTISPECIES: hypothetical protein [unclassified Streptomyces]